MPLVAGDCAQDLRRAITSVLAQDFTAFRLFILFSGPPDAEIDHCLSEFEPDPKIRIIREPHRLSAARARNLLLECVTQPVIAFIDSDDSWATDHLGTFARRYRPGKSLFFFTDFVLAQTRQRVRHRPPRRSLAYLLQQPILMSSVIMTRLPIRFRDIRAEDFVFCHDCLKLADEVHHEARCQVTYDLKRKLGKGLVFRLIRTRAMLKTLVDRWLAAEMLTALFLLFHLARRVRI